MTNDFEKAIIEIWRAVLRSDDLVEDSHFFFDGGDSLDAVIFVTELENQLAIDFPLDKLFKNPRLSDVVTAAKTLR